jgi:hypothetical protein
LFEAGYLSQVIGLRLTDGRGVVVKVRAWQERLIGCGQVQHSLSVAGFPAPRLLVPPERLGRLGVSAEALLHGGALLAAELDWAARFAEALALLVRTAPDPATVSIACVGWLGSRSPEALAGAGRSRRRPERTSWRPMARRDRHGRAAAIAGARPTSGHWAR